ncbi:MAG: hypothetical protein R3B13_39650 [Polyangiaceae bacterium]
MTSRVVVGVLLSAGLVLAASQANADKLPYDPPPAASAESAAPAPSASAAPAAPAADESPSHARRPIVVGLIAAGFLLIAGLVGANDRPGGDAKPS